MLRKSLGVLLGIAIALSVSGAPTFAQKKTNQGKLWANDADAPQPKATTSGKSKSNARSGKGKPSSVRTSSARTVAANHKPQAKQNKTATTKPLPKKERHMVAF